MLDISQIKDDLVSANRILAYHHVVDSFGHVSMRHPTNPNHFLLSRARAPNCVEIGDIMEFKHNGDIVGEDDGLGVDDETARCQTRRAVAAHCDHSVRARQAPHAPPELVGAGAGACAPSGAYACCASGKKAIF